MLLFFLISVALVAIDQITKALAVAYLKPVTTVPIIKNVLHLTYHENTGAAFSILSGFRWVFVVLAVIVCGVIIYVNMAKKIKSKLFYVSSIFIVSGAVGNLMDRIATGSVVDFVDFRLINFPVFNFADVCLTCGAILLFVYLIFFYGNDKSRGGKGAQSDDKDKSD